MKRIILFITAFSMMLAAQAQLVKSAPKDEIQNDQGQLTYPLVISGAAFPEDNRFEGFVIEGKLRDKGVLIQDLQYYYDAYGDVCVESMRVRVTRSAPERIEGGLITHKVPGYSNSEIITITFMPDNDMKHWSGTYTIGRIPKHETCNVEFIDCKCIEKIDFQPPKLIDSEK